MGENPRVLSLPLSSQQRKGQHVAQVRDRSLQFYEGIYKYLVWILTSFLPKNKKKIPSLEKRLSKINYKRETNYFLLSKSQTRKNFIESIVQVNI